jgi:hypothetical protein
MPRYFMNLHSPREDIIDDEGMEIAVGKVHAAALNAARDCISGDVMAGKLELDCRIEVLDEAGRLVQSLAFIDAVEISERTRGLFLT